LRSQPIFLPEVGVALRVNNAAMHEARRRLNFIFFDNPACIDVQAAVQNRS
jgi:hypothetical protein